jgi:hypothetical protein
MFTEVVDDTATVDTVKLALSALDGIKTLVGTEATDGLLLDSATTAPPTGATPDNVAVPCDDVPPTTLVGFSVTEDMLTGGSGFTVNEALLEVPE